MMTYFIAAAEYSNVIYDLAHWSLLGLGYCEQLNERKKRL